MRKVIYRAKTTPHYTEPGIAFKGMYIHQITDKWEVIIEGTTQVICEARYEFLAEVICDAINKDPAKLNEYIDERKLNENQND